MKTIFYVPSTITASLIAMAEGVSIKEYDPSWEELDSLYDVCVIDPLGLEGKAREDDDILCCYRSKRYSEEWIFICLDDEGVYDIDDIVEQASIDDVCVETCFYVMCDECEAGSFVSEDALKIILNKCENKERSSYELAATYDSLRYSL